MRRGAHEQFSSTSPSTTHMTQHSHIPKCSTLFTIVKNEKQMHLTQSHDCLITILRKSPLCDQKEDYEEQRQFSQGAWQSILLERVVACCAPYWFVIVSVVFCCGACYTCRAQLVSANVEFFWSVCASQSLCAAVANSVLFTY